MDIINTHAKEAYPKECCGILIGETDGQHWRISQVMRAKNILESSARDRYQMDPADRFRAEQEARKAQKAVVGFYHSHPDHDVYFSQTDIENSEEFLLGKPWVPPNYAYLVMGVWKGTPKGRGAFLVIEGKSTPLDLRVEVDAKLR